MNTLTKEQVGRLTPEQQEDLATLELRRVAKREQILKAARGSKVFIGVQVAFYSAVLFLAMSSHFASPLVFALVLLAAMSCGQMIATNRRIDALFELYKREKDDAA